MALVKLKEKKNYTRCKDCASYGKDGCGRGCEPYRIGSYLGKAIYDCRWFCYKEPETKGEEAEDIEKSNIIVAERLHNDEVNTDENTPVGENELKSGDLSDDNSENEQVIAEEAKIEQKPAKAAKTTKSGAKTSTRSKKESSTKNK